MAKLGYWLWMWKKWTDSRDINRASVGFCDFRKRGGSGSLFVLYFIITYFKTEWVSVPLLRPGPFFHASPSSDPILGILVLSLTYM